MLILILAIVAFITTTATWAIVYNLTTANKWFKIYKERGRDDL